MARYVLCEGRSEDSREVSACLSHGSDCLQLCVYYQGVDYGLCKPNVNQHAFVRKPVWPQGTCSCHRVIVVGC